MSQENEIVKILAQNFFSGRFLIIIPAVLISAIMIVYVYLLIYPPAANPPATLQPSGAITDEDVIEEAASIIKSGDYSKCDSVSRDVDGINYRTVCRNNIFSKIALESLDFTACDKLDNVLKSISDCKKIVLNMLIKKEGALSACEKVPSDMNSFCSDVYWNFTAVNKLDPRLCAGISSAAGISKCQKNLLSISITEDKDIDCSLFTENSVKSECAAYKSGKGKCDTLTDPALLHDCEHK